MCFSDKKEAFSNFRFFIFIFEIYIIERMDNIIDKRANYGFFQVSNCEQLRHDVVE